MELKFTELAKGIEDKLQAMVDRSKSIQSYLAGNVYRQYQNAQRQRWITENESEQGKWKPLNTTYASYKKRRYGGGIKYKWVGGQPHPWIEDGSWPSYEGRGEKTLIATGKLKKSVIGPGEGHYVLVTPSSLTISTQVEYAPFVAADRQFMNFSYSTIKEMLDGISQFIDGKLI